MNDITITIPSDLIFERVVRESAAVVARQLGFTEERVADLQLAVSEAVSNAIEHGNKLDSSIKVGVRFVIEPTRLAVEVSDRGHWSGVLQHYADFSVETALVEDAPRGMGIYLIRRLVDDVGLSSSADGTQITLWFNIESQARTFDSVGRYATHS